MFDTYYPDLAGARRSIRSRALASAIFLAGAATPLSAQTAAAQGQTVYPATFFTPFSPANALEIVKRVPGFVLEKVDEDIRGFSQAAGNVVINGQRPSSKSDTIDVILSRIPANRVVRIEVGSGERFGSDYSSKAQVLNLVLSDAGGLAGTIEGGVKRDFTGRVLPNGSASALLKRGRSTFNASATLTNNSTSEQGFDRITTLPGDALSERREKVNHNKDPIASLSASWAFDDGANRGAHLNTRISREWLSLDQVNSVFPVGGPNRNDTLTERYNRHDFELGGDVSRPLAGGGIKLIGLMTRRHRNYVDTIAQHAGGSSLGGFEQSLVDDKAETLGRLVWSRSALRGWTVEFGGEAALNRLNSDVGLFNVAPDGIGTRIDLPIDQAVVKEKRGELFVNAGRPITSTLRLDLGLTYEASRLTVTGDAHADRALAFLKPKATIDWRPRGGWHAQLSLARSVSQLQFENFISGATLTTGQLSGGNADLLPQRSWNLLGTIEHPILGDGLIKLELGHNRISKVQDRVPTGGGLDAPGNLGPGKEWIARAKIDAPLGGFAIKGGRLTLYGSYDGTSVRDPYTLQKRPFSGFNAFYFEINFRQDLGKFAWGVDATGNTHSTTYRINELDSFSQQNPYTSLFVEYRPSPRTTVNFTLGNITQATSYRKRTFFAPDRTNPSPDLFELRHRNKQVIPFLKVKHSFG